MLRHRRATVLVAYAVRERSRISRKQGRKYFSAQGKALLPQTAALQHASSEGNEIKEIEH